MLPHIEPYTLASSPSPDNKTQWIPDPQQALLLIHDMQNHFVDVFDSGPNSQIDVAISNMKRLCHYARKEGVPIVYTAQPAHQCPQDRQLLTDFWGEGLNSAEKAKIIADLSPQTGETVLTKWRYCAFYRTDLDDRMRNHGKKQLWLTGIYSHIGCLSTALTAFMKGYKVFFISDAQADFSLADHQFALKYVATRCGQVMTTNQMLAPYQRPTQPIGQKGNRH